jgi:tRNA threonylcarbamoyladenosine biosynthesis protein TsaB
MRLLAIDTTEDACSAALMAGDEVIERFEIAPRRHSELILPMMQGLLDDAGLALTDLDALAFARGPGAFTGLRIAASVTQGAAMGADLPVVPVSSLQALAQGCVADGRFDVLAAFDARMGEVYWGAYRCDEAGIMRGIAQEQVSRPDQVTATGGERLVGAGSGWAAHGDVLASCCGALVGRLTEARVHAADVARLAAVLYEEAGAVDVVEAVPVYLRDRVATAR